MYKFLLVSQEQAGLLLKIIPFCNFSFLIEFVQISTETPSCWIIAKVEVIRGDKKRQKKSELFPPGQDVRQMRIIWCGWAGSEKVRKEN